MSARPVWEGLPPVTPAGQPLLADPALQAELDDVGFVIVPLLAPDALAALLGRYELLHPEPGHGFELDLASVSPDHKRRVDETLDPVWRESLAPLLLDPTFFMSSFAVKWPGEASGLPVHQDWSCVDEERDRSFVAWLALDDIDPDRGNGALAVLPGSHRFLAPPRGAMTIPWYWEYGGYIARHLHHLRLRAGEIALLDGRLIHASEPNRSAGPRRAAVTRIARRSTPLVYVDHTDAGLDLYEVDHDFYIERGPLDLRSRPPDRHRVIGRRSNAVPVVDPVELAALCGSDEPPVPSGEPLTRDQLLGAPGSDTPTRRSRPPRWTLDGDAAAERLAASPIDPDAGSPAAWTSGSSPYVHRRCELTTPTGDPALDETLATVPGRLTAAYLAVVPPGGRLRIPQGDGRWSGVLTIAAPAVHGAAALRLGDRHVPLATGTTSVFETGDDGELWNLGGTACVLLGWRADVALARLRSVLSR